MHVHLRDGQLSGAAFAARDAAFQSADGSEFDAAGLRQARRAAAALRRVSTVLALKPLGVASPCGSPLVQRCAPPSAAASPHALRASMASFQENLHGVGQTLKAVIDQQRQGVLPALIVCAARCWGTVSNPLSCSRWVILVSLGLLSSQRKPGMARLSKISSHARTAGNYCNASMSAFTEPMLRYLLKLAVRR